MSAFPRPQQARLHAGPDPWFDLRMAAIKLMIGVVASVGTMVLPSIL